ncbi:MAG: FkbM family methyltransferase [Actinobacteria bacterium]|nr:FkbM family methyltransferase [Actinomycetota bacterium]
MAHDIGNGAYDFESFPISPGDVLLDIGAHVGVVSAWLAQRYPYAFIVACEPFPDTFNLLTENLVANRVTNVLPLNLALSGDGRFVDLISHPWSNSGGSTAQLADMNLRDHIKSRVISWTLDELLYRLHITQCTLLKIDCEGSEYEILLSSRQLSRIKMVRGELHINSRLRVQGYSPERLMSHLNAYGIDASFMRCEMAE